MNSFDSLQKSVRKYFRFILQMRELREFKRQVPQFMNGKQISKSSYLGSDTGENLGKIKARVFIMACQVLLIISISPYFSDLISYYLPPNTLIQLTVLLCYFSNMPDIILPERLCTHDSFLKCSSPEFSHLLQVFPLLSPSK